MGMEIPPPFLNLIVQVGDAVDDRHWRFLYPVLFGNEVANVAKPAQKSARDGLYLQSSKRLENRGVFQ
jgi:hypothetical protein